MNINIVGLLFIRSGIIYVDIVGVVQGDAGPVIKSEFKANK